MRTKAPPVTYDDDRFRISPADGKYVVGSADRKFLWHEGSYLGAVETALMQVLGDSYGARSLQAQAADELDFSKWLPSSEILGWSLYTAKRNAALVIDDYLRPNVRRHWGEHAEFVQAFGDDAAGESTGSILQISRPGERPTSLATSGVNESAFNFERMWIMARRAFTYVSPATPSDAANKVLREFDWGVSVHDESLAGRADFKNPRLPIAGLVRVQADFKLAEWREQTQDESFARFLAADRSQLPSAPFFSTRAGAGKAQLPSGHSSLG